MLNIEISPLADALRRALPGMSPETAAKRASDLICDTDSRLTPNVQEWIEGKPIRDLWIGQYCVNAIMSIRGDGDFISALEAMNLYLRDPRAGERRIWRFRK